MPTPQLPQLIDDVKKLGQVSATYQSVVPELARFLRNTVVTGNTFVSQEDKIQALFDDVASFSKTSRDFLQANGDNIVRLSQQGKVDPAAAGAVLAGVPVPVQGAAQRDPAERSVPGGKLHIILELLPQQPRGYNPGEAPVYDERAGPSRTATCSPTPLPAVRPGQPSAQRDREEHERRVQGTIAKRVAPGYDVSSGYAGTAAEKDLIAAIIARSTGQSVDDVPDIATLLFGPLARGTAVNAPMKLARQAHRQRRVKLVDLHRGHHLATAMLAITIGNVSFGATQVVTRPSSPTPPA